MFNSSSLKRYATVSSWVVLPTLVYIGILLTAVPGGKWGLLPILAVSIALLYFSSALPEWLRGPAGFTAILLLLGFSLSQVWSTGESNPTLIGGLLPWSDANGYYRDASVLLEGGALSNFSGRRPLFPALLSVLLALTHQNLQAALAILVFILGFAIYVLFREVEHTLGKEAATLIFILLFVYSKRFIGTTMTENMGLPVGILSLALIWRGAESRKKGLILSGLFMLTLGLNSRAGAFLILPALILWGAWLFRKTGRLSIQFLVLGIGAVGLAFGVNHLLDKLLAIPGAVPFSNFSYTLYGLVSGGKGWMWVLTEHPELEKLAEPGRSLLIYQMAIAKIQSHPQGLVQGVLKSWSDYLSLEYLGAYGFLFVSGKDLINKGIRLVLYLLTALGLFRAIQKRQSPYCPLTLAALTGIWFSIPFVPPMDADGMRAYAATIAFWFVLPALGLHLLAVCVSESAPIRRLSRRIPRGLFQPGRPVSSTLFLVSGMVLLAFAIVGGPAVKFLDHPVAVQRQPCKNGLVTLYAPFTKGAWLDLVDDNTVQKTKVPTIRLTDFQKGLSGIGDPELIHVLSSLKAPAAIAYVVDSQNNASGFIILPGRPVALANHTILQLCGQWLNLHQKYVLMVESYVPVEEAK